MQIFLGVRLMNNKKHYGRKALTLALTAALVAGAFGSLTAVSAAEDPEMQSYELKDNIQDGTILHCFDWKYNDIKDELEDIARAGFSTIQTSPAQMGANAGTWFWLYQPLGFSVQDNGLGTKEELKELCEAADEYGIKVVVDVVANHLAGDHDNIQEDLQDEQYWHDLGEVENYNDRNQVINGDIGMQDLKSEDPHVQDAVKAYIKELKDIGVDGIRWDAAKHIGLPSEDCEFWPAVTEEFGLYNYGEILSSPGGVNAAELMSEYTNYMSVTDDTYSDSLLASFRRGTAPTISGNWIEDGISADKLVLWGESHDTYSNAEGQGSNGAAQNEVDRAYAVVAARNGSSALYFSRPAATARDSIRIGDRGSLHFTSPEIAAVNHFHNAMAGLEDCYTVSGNNAVITRNGGGAVIVCGSGSGEVNVENGNGYAVPGTYKDEVTGNEFVVTEDTIKGTVGESGIAVIFNSSFTSRVEASVETGTVFNTDTLEVKLSAMDVTNAEYKTSEGDEGTFTNGDVISIGAQTNSGEVVTLTLTGTNKNGKVVKAVYKYTKQLSKQYPELNGGGVIFDNTNTGWSTVNIYVYDESDPNNVIKNGEWPGVAMEDCGDNLYKYELPENLKDCTNIMVIFNNNEGDQIPAAMQAGLTMAYNDQKVYDGTNWIDLEEVNDPIGEPGTESGNESSAEQGNESSTEQSDESSTEPSNGSGTEPSNDSGTEPSNDSGTEPSNGSDTEPSNSTGDNQTSGSDDGNAVVNTSDNAPVTALIFVLLASIAVGTVVLSRKRKTTDDR